MKAFTLLETLLAVALGGVMVVVVVGLFAAMDLTDRALAIRHRQAEEMAILHRAMDRAFSNLLMARDAEVQEESQNRSGVRVSRPRVLLEEDPAVAGMSGGAVPQRLEVVVSRPPVPPGFGRDVAASAEELEETGPVRGVFELRPEEGGWAMWWRTLPPATDDPDGELYQTDPRQDPRAVRLATGLTEARWLAFHKRVREPAIAAKVSHDLPAHMELHVRMSSGYAAQWMFEVQWLNGPETAEEIAEEQEQALAAEGSPGPGRPGGGAGGGATTGPATRTNAGGTTTTQRGRNVARPAMPHSDGAPPK